MLVAAAAAVLVGVLIAGLIAQSGPVDPPRARGSHAQPTPTSGGLAILAGTCLGAVLAARGADLGGPELWRAAVVLAVAAGLGVLGAADDMLDLGAKPKLLIQMVVALVFALTTARIERVPLGGGLVLPLGPWLGAAGTALWIVVATNAVNFMDGANGVAAGALAIALTALGLGALQDGQPAVAAVALAGAAANAGYLPWNLGGRLFQGDAGALFSGFLLAGLAVVAEQGGRGVYVYFAPLALLPFLTDVLLTLLWRARRGRNLLEAHRDHLYQLWLRTTGETHAALAARVAMVMILSGSYAVAVEHARAAVQPLLFVAGLIACILGWLAVRRHLEARAVA